jgi:hypothetical protein
MSKTPYAVPREIQSNFGDYGMKESWLSLVYDLRSEFIHKNTSRLKFDDNNFMELSFEQSKWGTFQEGFPRSAAKALPDVYSVACADIDGFILELMANFENFIDAANNFSWPQVPRN